MFEKRFDFEYISLFIRQSWTSFLILILIYMNQNINSDIVEQSYQITKYES